MAIAGLAVYFLILVACAVAHEAWADDNATSDARTPPQSEVTLGDALLRHRQELNELKTRLAQLEQLKATLLDKLTAYDAENAANRQLLMISVNNVEDLEHAIAVNHESNRKLNLQDHALKAQYDQGAILFSDIEDHIKTAREKLDEIRSSNMPHEKARDLEATVNALIQILQEKRTIGRRYQEIYEKLLSRIDASLKENQDIGEDLAATIANRIKGRLFTATNRYDQFLDHRFEESLKDLEHGIGDLFSASNWRARFTKIKAGGIYRWAGFAFWLAIIIGFQSRWRNLLQRLERAHEGVEWYYRRMVIFLMRRSLLYFGLTLLFGIYGINHSSLLGSRLSWALFHIFLLLLVMRWGLDYMQYRSAGPSSGLRDFVCLHLKRLFKSLRVIIIAIILFRWVAGGDSLLLWSVRDALSMGVLVWVFLFWRRLKVTLTEITRNGMAAPNPHKIAFWKAWSYLVCGGGLLLSMAGYGALAGHWASSWIRTITICFWGWCSFSALREWQAANQARQEAVGYIHHPDGHRQIGWAALRLMWLVWIMSIGRGLIWAWDSAGFLMLQVKSVFEASFLVGNLNLSIKGIVLAVVIIFLTHLAVHIGRALVAAKVFEKRGVEPGLKESITTILSYLGWGLGSLVALASIGVNATSLAVVFGALSVGIGFGLQNIFNNFISGLILLFERPIQVGDIVEVNGIWAEVKKINVRATVVQTFDNASVIIPNSEFISQQVTNWSFKDKRMRRHMDIGVAYGSDIDLVEKTLSEIAQNSDKVLKYPKPDVIFTDHADSALIFRLRFWVHVDEYWAVPSKLRFAIDKRFRELGIEIAFPQRDIHIRTLPEETSQTIVPT